MLKVVGSAARLRVEAAMIRKSAISYRACEPISKDGEGASYRFGCIEVPSLQLHNAEEFLALNAVWFTIEYPSCEASG